jgi:iron complex transport system permease protein
MKKLYLFIVLIVTLVISFYICLFYNTKDLAATGSMDIIIWQIRLPRIILGLFVGAGLAVSGCVFQSILRNPLADSYTLGVSGGCALGVTLGSILGLTRLFGMFAMPVSSFIGGLTTILLIYLISARKKFSVAVMILSGVILSFVSSSIVLFIFSISDVNKVQNTILWLMGDLSAAETGLIKVVSAFILIGTGLLVYFSRDLNLLSLGEEKAVHLGLDAEKSKKLFFIVASFITGACVSAAGIIGFVGLIIPHLIRKFTGPNNVSLIPASALAGAIFLMVSDTIARTVISPVELPVGVITGIVGGIFFLFYLVNTKKWELF